MYMTCHSIPQHARQHTIEAGTLSLRWVVRGSVLKTRIVLSLHLHVARAVHRKHDQHEAKQLHAEDRERVLFGRNGTLQAAAPARRHVFGYQGQKSHAMQVNPDAGWLESIACVCTASDYWVVGEEKQKNDLRRKN